MSSTHDWSALANTDHVLAVQNDFKQFSEGGITHLILEVIAYAVDEAIEGTTDQVSITLRKDGSICIADNGRGTQTREVAGIKIVKPIMATPDLRFFGIADAPLLPDGRVRSGISVVSAMSEWLTHTNRRDSRGWMQRYEYGLPSGPLMEVVGDGATGTVVCFHPDATVFGPDNVSAQTLRELCIEFGRVVDIAILDEQNASMTDI